MLIVRSLQARSVNRQYGVGMDSKVIALFPLPQPLLPGEVRALRLFEPRYRQLAADLVAMPEHQRQFGIVALGPGTTSEGPQSLHLYLTGTIAEVTSLEVQDDGTAYVETVGTDRFRIRGISQDRSYLQADVTIVAETDGPDCQDAVTDFLIWYDRYFSLAMPVLAAAGRISPDQLRSSVDVMTHWPPKLLISAAMTAMSASAAQVQTVLESATYAEALTEVRNLLTREVAALHVTPSLPLRVETLVTPAAN